MGVAGAFRRAIVGRRLRSTQLGETLLPKRIALPIFASDALSSVAYAPDEIFLTLSMGGVSAYAFNWKIGLAVGAVLLVVVASYRQNVHAYPSGGGGYEVATVNLGHTAGVTVASALMVDYTLTVAVSIASGVQNAAAAVPFIDRHTVIVAVAMVVILTAMNLRGTKESGKAFAVPTYLFIASIVVMAGTGIVRFLLNDLPTVPSAKYDIAPDARYAGSVTALASAFLLARAFASGCAALTGVEAISNAVPAFKRPKSHNAATTLALLGGIAVTMMMSILLLADKMHLRYVEDPTTQLLLHGKPLGSHSGYDQDTVIGQLSKALFSGAPIMFYFTIATTGIILVLAANTAFNGFPVLGSILARDGYLPHQLHTRGDRLAYSNGILTLAFFAIVLIIAFQAQVTHLIQLYIVGVFVSFTLSQTGMVKHWTRLLADEPDPAVRRKMHVSRAINAVGLVFTGLVLVVVVITKFLAGAWIAITAMVVLFIVMKTISRHYARVETALAIDDTDITLPSRIHAVVIVGKLNKPVMRALVYAKAARPDMLEALTADLDPEATAKLVDQWDTRHISVPLRIVESPYRETVRPVTRYMRELRKKSPRDLVVVYIPEYVVGRWWENLLHNQTALRLKGRLLFVPGVTVTSVPYQLPSASRLGPRTSEPGQVVGGVRRGIGLDD